MAGFTEKVQVVIDVTAANATSTLGKLKTSLSQTEGAFNKIKAGASSLMSSLGTAGVAGLVAGAAAAIGDFGKKSIDQFQKTALAADKFADASGLSVETASKWIAVADDVGIGADTFQNAFVKMEKAIGSNRKAFGDLIVTAKDGSVDLSGTFLKVIAHLQAIPDPIQRATESAKLFGKGFAEVSEIISTDAGTLAQKLGQVSEAQIIDAGEVAKAREYQAAMDALSDAARDLMIQVGEGLVPALSSAADALANLSGLANTITFGHLSESTQAFTTGLLAVPNLLRSVFAPSLAETGTMLVGIQGDFDSVTAKAGGWGQKVGESAAKTREAARAHTEFQDAMRGAAAAIQAQEDALNGLLDAQLAQLDGTLGLNAAQRQFADAMQTATKATDDASTASNEQAAAYDDATSSALQVASKTADLAEEQAKLAGKTFTANDRQKALVDTLRVLAAGASGPTKQALEQLIGKLQETGRQNPKPKITVDDQASGPVNNIKSRIAGVTGKSVTVSAHATGVEAINSSLNNAARSRTVTFRVQQVGSFHVPYLHPDGRFYAKGGLVDAPRGMAVPATVHGGEYVLSADVVDRIKRGVPSAGARGGSVRGGESGGTTVIFNGPVYGDRVAFGRMVKQAVAAADRAGVN